MSVPSNWGGSNPLKTLNYHWLSGVSSLNESKIIGEITNSDWWFHQEGDAFAIIDFYSSAGSWRLKKALNS